MGNARMKAKQIVDCHAHIIDPSRFPYDDGPGYKPKPHEVGTQEAYVAALDRDSAWHLCEIATDHQLWA